MDGLIASRQKPKGLFTENQLKAYPEIANGNATAVAACGSENGDLIVHSNEIRIHTNDSKGNIVDLTFK